MLFNSWHFLIFFPAVVLLHFSIPHAWRKTLLLIASCVFYMFFVWYYIFILLATIAVDYAAALYLERRHAGPAVDGVAAAGISKKNARIVLVLSLIANFGVLFVFKYFNFFNENVDAVAQFFGVAVEPWALQLILPIGLSFHTFQSAGYLIEVYRGDQHAEQDPQMLALFVMFFPQLVAGPIERPANLIPQLQARRFFDRDEAVSGLKLMLWGFFKKLVVADRLAMYVDPVYNNAGEFSGWPLIVATYFFAFQIYCDFSGYSDIAIGAARVLGVRLMTNFRTPYFSTGFADFWRRWHISLSTWFRDYLYIPLGGSRAGLMRVYVNLMIVFVVSGLWHGASWNFVIWGGIHGALLILERIASGLWVRVYGGPLFAEGSRAATAVACLKMIFVFHCAVLAWVFFRAPGFEDAAYVLTHLFAEDRVALHIFPLEVFYRKTGVVVIVLLVLFEALRASSFVERGLPGMRRFGLNYAYYAFLCAAILLLGAFYGQSFIYFQF